MRVVLLVICAVAATTVGAFAQNRALSGTVTDNTRQGLPGVAVSVKGTTLGTITDVDGKFSLSVPATAKTLVFSFVGMTTQEVAIGNQSTFTISLKEETKALEEVVVVGFGRQKKESVVGSIVTANQESLKRTGSPSNLAQALTGQLAGVTTITSTGEPGNDDPRIIIRAQGTWNNSQPLILVDGVERKMNDIDISEVESISVLKDASATAVFGVKGSEGVILITTKRGQLGKPQLSVDANFTLKDLSKVPEKLGSYDDMLWKNAAIEHELPAYEGNWLRTVPMQMVNYYKNSPGFDRNSLIPNSPYTYSQVFPDVNWAKEMTKPFAVSNRVNLNVSGGTDFAKYFGSLSYTHDGDLLSSGMKTNRPYQSQWAYDRFNFRTNVDFNVTKTTVFSVNLSGYVGTKMDAFNASTSGNSAFWSAFYNLSPAAFIPQWPDGFWGSTTVGNVSNPIQMINNFGIRKVVRTQVTSDFKLEQNLDFITKGLRATASLSYDTRFFTSGGIFDRGDGAGSRYVDPMIIYMKPGETYQNYTYGTNRAAGLLNFDWVPQPVSYYGESFGSFAGDGLDYYGQSVGQPYRRLYYQGKLDYSRKFGKSDLAATAVVDREEFTPGNNFPFYREDWIGRLTYAYDGKYFFESNGAYNGSERFSRKNRFGFFPSLAIGWMISNEPWMKRDWLDKMKLRYSWGKVGNDNFSANRWAYQTLWATGDRTNYGSGSMVTSPYLQYVESGVGNPDLQWEESIKQNYGFEAAVFKNLVNLNVEYFVDNRDKIFMSAGQRQIPAFWGAAPVAANLGKTHTQGYEIELKLNKSFGNLNAWASTAFTHAKDEIIFEEDPILLPAYQKAAGYQIGQTKNQLPAGYVNNWNDVFAMTSFSSNNQYKLPGDIRIMDFNADGTIDQYDNAPWGYPTRPQNTYNYSLGADYKGWSFMVQFYGVNNVSRFVSLPPLSDNTYTIVYGRQSDYWTPENMDAAWKAPRFTNNTSDGTLNMYDASYFRLKTAEIAYQFQDKVFLKKLGLSSLRIYLNGNNLWLWTNMPDDREDGSSNNAIYSDQTAYPNLKRINLGLTVKF